MIVGGLLACASAPSTATAADHESPAATTVVEIHCTFVDTARSVPDFATRPPSTYAKVRSLPTALFLSRTSQPVERPLILFASGYDSYPSIYSPLLSAWARAGFVVAAPIFPDENPGAVATQRANTEGDLANEPADMAYVGRALEAASLHRSSSCPAIYRSIDPKAVLVSGHSDGAVAAAALAFGVGTDPQGASDSALRSGFALRGAMIFSGGEDGLGPYGAPAPQLPLLMVQSAGDHCNPERDAVALYRATPVEERFFLLLRSAQHRAPFDGTDVPAFNLVSSTSIRFAKLAARGAQIGAGFVAFGDRSPATGSIFIDPPVTTALSPNCVPS